MKPRRTTTQTTPRSGGGILEVFASCRRGGLSQDGLMRPLFPGKDHHRVAGEFEAEEISRPKLNSASLLFRAASYDAEPTGLLAV